MRLPVIIIILSYLVLIVTDAMIIHDLKVMSLYDKYKPERKDRCNWWKVYGIFAILIIILLTVAICLPRREADSGITATMWMLFIVITVELSQLAYCIFSWLGFLPRLFRIERWNTGLWVGLPVAALIFTAMWWGALIGRNKIQVVDVEITSPKLPESFNGYKIAQISDLHVGTWGNDTSFVSRLVDKVNEQHPDLIVFTGDAVNRESKEFIPFIQPLSRLKAKDGVYAILGNHDYGDYVTWKKYEAKRANLDSLKTYLSRAGWKLLDNDHANILNAKGDSIVLIGVGNWGEPPFSQYGDIDKAYPQELHNDDHFKILLSHNPQHWEKQISRDTNIDITLAGHTHAMQIMLSVGNWRWSPAKFRYDEWGGLYSKENENKETTRVYVNIGAGEVGMPMRVGATPEITLLTLHN